jgi:hypothetical protein
MSRCKPQEHGPWFYWRLAVAVVNRAVEDLDHPDPRVKAEAYDFIFGDNTEDLERWMLMCGSTSVKQFRAKLERRRRSGQKPILGVLETDVSVLQSAA